jgi:hypothetical protein
VDHASPAPTPSAAPDRDPRPCPCPGCGNRGPDVEPGWHHHRGPALVLGARRGEAWTDRPSWVDHPYRVRQHDGTWAYVAEPYDLGPESLDDLARLRAEGWRVTVSAWGARHRPGHTMAVVIRLETPD